MPLMASLCAFELLWNPVMRFMATAAALHVQAAIDNPMATRFLRRRVILNRTIFWTARSDHEITRRLFTPRCPQTTVFDIL